jgi:hypothetical protein
MLIVAVLVVPMIVVSVLVVTLMTVTSARPCRIYGHRREQDERDAHQLYCSHLCLQSTEVGLCSAAEVIFPESIHREPADITHTRKIGCLAKPGISQKIHNSSSASNKESGLSSIESKMDMSWTALIRGISQQHLRLGPVNGEIGRSVT